MPDFKKLKNLVLLLPKKQRFLVAGLLLVSALALLSIPFGAYFNFTSARPDYGGDFTEGVVGEPRLVNPLLLQTDADRDLAQLVFSGLLKNDGQGNFVPDLAEKYSISQDGLTYTFNLRRNVKWHDGRDFTADDVVFTVRTAQNPDFSSPLRINWQGVEVSKIDEFTVEFKLKNPFAQFFNNLTLGILPAHLWQEITASGFLLSELNQKPVGAGPYKFYKLKKDRLGRIVSYELLSHRDYHLGRPYIDSITLKFYSSEEEMIQSFNFSDIESLGGISAEKEKGLRFPGKVSVKKVEVPRYYSVFFNQNQSEVLSDKNVRLALAHAVNKDEIIDALGGNGIKISSPVLPEIFSDYRSDIKRYDYNPLFAAQILRNSGWTDEGGDGFLEKKGKNLEMELTVSLRPELLRMAGALKAEWEKIGVRVNLNEVSVSELQQNSLQNRDYEAILIGEILNLEPDPLSFWHSSQKKYPGLNLALYDNKGADKLLEEARQTLDQETRAKKYADLQNLVIEDLPAVFLYSPLYLYPMAEKIKGFEDAILALPSERFVNAHKWYIETKRVRK